MSIKYKLLGLKKQVLCDRCGETILETLYPNLCPKCFSINPCTIRKSAIKVDPSHQNNTKNIKCDICSSEEPLSSSKQVCSRCVSTHPDTTHAGFEPVPSIGKTRVNYCFRCGGVQIATVTSEATKEYLYFKVSSKEGQAEPFPCPDHSRIILSKIEKCEHDWIKIYSDVVSDSEKLKRQKELEADSRFLDLNVEEFEILCSGSTVYWCWKCGCFHNLVPRKDTLLPKKGRRKV